MKFWLITRTDLSSSSQYQSCSIPGLKINCDNLSCRAASLMQDLSRRGNVLLTPEYRTPAGVQSCSASASATADHAPGVSDHGTIAGCGTSAPPAHSPRRSAQPRPPRRSAQPCPGTVGRESPHLPPTPLAASFRNKPAGANRTARHRAPRPAAAPGRRPQTAPRSTPAAGATCQRLAVPGFRNPRPRSPCQTTSRSCHPTSPTASPGSGDSWSGWC